VEYRERLGGYYRVQQLLEIEDFPETAVAYFIIPDNTQLRKLNINRLSLNELKRHPYLNFYQARAIVDYRRLHGTIQSLDQLSLLRDFPREAIERLTPYVEY
jgi:DNA uptake protein ComE-like DNA-binding protein